MNQFKKLKSLLIISNLLIMPACSVTETKGLNDSKDEDICTDINQAKGSPAQVEDIWKDLTKRHEKNRKLVVFMDGTRNDEATNTNVWRLYKQSLKHACSGNGNPVIPYYITGLGTTLGNLALGSGLGFGAKDKIIDAYDFLKQAYKKGDEIFIFGFSRGAFTARSLNGMLEYGGLLKANDSKTQELYDVYNKRHDGSPSFLETLKSDLSKNFDFITPKIEVAAIGVFDTVPSIGRGTLSIENIFSSLNPMLISSGRFLYNNPDDHRTDLYAKKGFHAMSLDEQRTGFELLRFPKYKGLEEVWFSGGHENIGGQEVEDEKGSSEKGLSKLAFDWMISKFKEYQIFPSSSASVCEASGDSCEGGKLWDSFFTNSQGVDWKMGGVLHRRPKGTDFIHGSVFCRLKIENLDNNANPKREPNGIYKTFFIEKNDQRYSNIVDYQCHKTNN